MRLAASSVARPRSPVLIAAGRRFDRHQRKSLFCTSLFIAIVPLACAANLFAQEAPYASDVAQFSAAKGMQTLPRNLPLAVAYAAAPDSAADEGILPSAPADDQSAGQSTSGQADIHWPNAQANGDIVPLGECPFDTHHSPECRVHWHQLIISTVLFNLFQNSGNLYTGYYYRTETTTGVWFQRWINSAADWRWDRWSDNNPILDDYVAHPMMGAITNYLWIQNDPRGMTLSQSNTWPYYRSLLRATAFSTAYSFEWKLGPFGEAGIGHNGDHYFHDGGAYTNETGWVELVTTPVGGTLWTMAEDALDRHVITRLEKKSRNPLALFAYQFLSPARGAANILRFRPPWYRDSRTVKADSFWSDPPGTNESDHFSLPPREAMVPVRNAAVAPALPEWPRPGGVHEIGAWWGVSLMSGHLWGSAGDVKYMPMVVHYSYLFSLHDRWALRYSPELTALSMLSEPVDNPTNNPQLYRRRNYGSGLSPVGLQSDFFPSSRVQPFLSTNGGVLLFQSGVLAPQGSQFAYTVDFGGGVNIFRKARQAVSIGYRYQHIASNSTVGYSSSTDANTFYVSVSRFRTKGYR
jgi:hypothetical protein